MFRFDYSIKIKIKKRFIDWRNKTVEWFLQPFPAASLRWRMKHPHPVDERTLSELTFIVSEAESKITYQDILNLVSSFPPLTETNENGYFKYDSFSDKDKDNRSLDEIIKSIRIRR